MPQTRNNAAGNTAVVIRTGSTKINAVRVEQRVAAAPLLYLQLFNTATVTPGTTLPTKVVMIPAGVAELQAMILKETYSSNRGGLEFGAALTYCVTTVHDGGVAPTAGQEPVVIIDWEPLG